MLQWLDSFDTHIDIVDKQHKNLFAILQNLCDSFEAEKISKELLGNTIKQMSDYVQLHFSDEELLMHEYHLDARHTQLHSMEHRSFMYDTQQLGQRFSDIEAGNKAALKNLTEKIIRFITAWLTYHILGTDQMMAKQIQAIELGSKPEVAYEANHKVEYDVVTTRILLTAVMDLWQIANQHCHELEQKLAASQALQQKH